MKQILHRFFSIFGINFPKMSKIKKLSKTIIGIEMGTYKRDCISSVIPVNENNSCYIHVYIGQNLAQKVSYGNHDSSEFNRNEDLEILRKFINS